MALLNTTIKTRGDALLDLTIVHPALFLDIDCHVLNDNHRSDHQPIIIKFSGEITDSEKIPRWNFKKANWESFRNQCKYKLNTSIFDDQEDKMKTLTYLLR